MRQLISCSLTLLSITAACASSPSALEGSSTDSLALPGVAPAVGQTYQLINTKSGLALDVSGSSKANWAAITQEKPSSAASQQWTVRDAGSGGGWQLVNGSSGRCLDNNGTGSQQGVQMIQWDCKTSNAGNQQYAARTSGTGYKIVSGLNQLALDDFHQSTSVHAAVVLWADNGGTNQQWSFVPVLGPGQAQTPTVVPPERTIGWNPALPAWPVAYSDADKAQQRAAGQALLTSLGQALNSGASQFTVPPGVYRIAQEIEIDNTVNFTLDANNVEIIAEQGHGFFRFFSNQNLTVRGPLTLDGDSFGVTQGRIVAVDPNNSTIDVQIMDGYAAPGSPHRIMFFDPNGKLLPHWQDTPNSITQLSANTYRFSLWNSDFAYYSSFAGNIMKAGNYFSMENPDSGNGGFLMRYNRGMNFYDINYYSSSLLWALPEYGTDHFERFHGARRPGTSRLSAGGWMQMAYYGGAFELVDSEVSYNYDDLTDITSLAGWAYSQTSATQIIGDAGEGGPFVGDSIAFMDYTTSVILGTAKIIAITNDTNPADLAAAQAQARAANISVPGAVVIFTLDTGISLQGMAMMDNLTGKMDHITMTGSYLHDGLAWGFNGKGAKRVLFANNTAERVGFQCYSSTFDPYWSEGDIPGNIVMTGNVARDCSYSLPNPAPAMAVFDMNVGPNPQAYPIHSVTISKNIIVNPHDVGIGVSDADGVSITNNLIQNPVALAYEASWGWYRTFPDASAVYVKDVGPGTLIADNAFTQVDPLRVPELVRTDAPSAANVHISDNIAGLNSGAAQVVPAGIWTKVDDLQGGGVTYAGSWYASGSNLDYDGTLSLSGNAGDSVSFAFSGTQAHVYFHIGSRFGLANISVDNGQATLVDTSVLPASNLLQQEVGDQAVYGTGALSPGPHTLKVVVAGQNGWRSSGATVAVDGFDWAP